MSFLDEDEAQSVKGAVHGAIGVLAGEALIYNLAVYRKRGGWLHLLNIGLYTALIVVEGIQLRKHTS